MTSKILGRWPEPHRVERAIANSGFTRPQDRIVINLAPAELPKQAASFDLPITLGMLAGSGQLASDLLTARNRGTGREMAKRAITIAGRFRLDQRSAASVAARSRGTYTSNRGGVAKSGRNDPSSWICLLIKARSSSVILPCCLPLESLPSTWHATTKSVYHLP